MIDLHCHILPGIDDGAKDMNGSVQMAEAAVEEGITHILATPHHMSHHWKNERETVVRLVSELQEELDRRKIDLTIFPGQEIRIFGELLEEIDKGSIQFIDEHNQYLLIEFPTATVPTYTERLFFELQNKGITPIIVHPERNHAMYDDPEILKNLVAKGALAQLTAVSYTGGLGNKIQKFSKHLIGADLVHFIASDSHNVTNRPFYMKEAKKLVEKEYGGEKWRYFDQVTRKLVNGDVIAPPRPKSIKKKRFFGLF